ncbi:hypothetical protein O9K51_05430 [Purpureocillium lavendulum]|uniref:Uncharacterized protein n=1 Tax=Purpureocillium lavendulum TaxID=1247861 RepID=A0AB34FR64_9HYPO|nr:hypothetical protein O9K51_05430 [Purpureocillium lavendulum]
MSAHLGRKYFTQFEDLKHSVVEYVPLVGTVYSISRGFMATVEEDRKQWWIAIADMFESSIRDAVLVAKWAEPLPVMLIHNMAESFTEKMIEIYHAPPRPATINVKHMLKRNLTYVVVSESQPNQHAGEYFSGMAKGVYYFHGANFVGTLTQRLYASRGEEIRLQIPRGFYDGAPVMLSWRWTRDATGVRNRPEAVRGRIHLHVGDPPRFDVRGRKGAGNWKGHEFWGSINSRISITIYIVIEAEIVKVDMDRVEGT